MVMCTHFTFNIVFGLYATHQPVQVIGGKKLKLVNSRLKRPSFDLLSSRTNGKEKVVESEVKQKTMKWVRARA